MTFSDPATLGNVTGFLYICSEESFKHILWLLVVGRGVMLRPIFCIFAPGICQSRYFFHGYESGMMRYYAGFILSKIQKLLQKVLVIRK